jgi:hypothetical protein
MSIVHDVTRNVKKNRIFKIRYLIEAVEGVCDILDSSLCLALKEENSNISNSYPEKVGSFIFKPFKYVTCCSVSIKSQIIKKYLQPAWILPTRLWGF